MKKLFNELTSNEKVSFVINWLTINGLVPTYDFITLEAPTSYLKNRITLELLGQEGWSQRQSSLNLLLDTPIDFAFCPRLSENNFCLGPAFCLIVQSIK